MRLVIASLLLARIAAAQPGPPPPVDSTNGTTGETTPPPPPPPPTPPPAPMPHHMMMEPVAHEVERPEGLAFAIGVGYEFKTSLETPNIVSVRIRLPTGLTFEPLFIVKNSSTDMQMQPNPTISTSQTELAVGSLVRYPMIMHGRVDLDLLGSLVIDTVKVNPDGPDNDTRTTTLDAGWGLGLGFWISRHWVLTFNATNSLFSYSKVSMQTGPSTSDNTTKTALGLVFDPAVGLMIHLYN